MKPWMIVGLCLTPSGLCLAALAATWVVFRYEDWRWRRDQKLADRQLRFLAARNEELTTQALAEQLEQIRALPVLEPYNRWLR